ncbi:MAG: carbohydrate ABC transporter permease [Christensenellales bacterium]|jgi:putative aldouronate transport system permease protein
MNTKKIRAAKGEAAFYLINNIFLAVFFISVLYPIVYVLSASISSPRAVMSGQVILWPVELSLKGYEAAFRNSALLTGYANSMIYAVVGTLFNVGITLTTGYALSRQELIGRQFFNLLFAFTMWFGGGLIPNYLLVRSLGIMNTRWAMWLPGMMSVWNMVLCRTYIRNTIPEELFEAVMMDGCGYFRFFTHIVLPLSGAIIAVLAMFYAIGHWNAYFNAFIYLNNPALYPLQIILRDILIQNQLEMEAVSEVTSSYADIGVVEVLKYAVIMLACLPLWIIYPFVQRFFVKGVMIGSLKG